MTPWTVACHAPLSMGFPRQEHQSGLSFLFPGDLPDPGIESASPVLQADSLPLSHQESSREQYLLQWSVRHAHFLIVFFFIVMNSVILTILKCTVIQCTFTLLGNPYHYPLLELFSSFQIETFHPLSTNSLVSHPQTLATILRLSTSMSLTTPVPHISRTNNICPFVTHFT